MPHDKSPILQGTLDLMVLKTLEAMGPMHGYGIARRIEQIGEDAVQVNQGTIYLCLVRLVQQSWITAAWGTSEHNRRAKFYAITRRGQKQLNADTEYWRRLAAVMGLMFEMQPDGEEPS
jgi:transcriptional regulator